MTDNRRTALYDFHVSLGAKMVPFAGYAMPVQYPAGIIAEHKHTRSSAGLFDISHMGQILVEGEAPLEKLERLMPGDFSELADGQIRYSFLLNEQGGVLDDLMVTRLPDSGKAFLIVNAGGKDEDLAFIRQHLPDLKATMIEDRSLIALQGPDAAAVLERFCDAPAKLKFMQAATFTVRAAGTCYISRSGYTGEDGFEISVPSATVETFARMLSGEPEVAPIGLGARDSLRLEAGLCLYGHDLDPTTTPVEANLVWAIGKRRRAEGGFTAAAIIQEQLAKGVSRKRVGVKPEGRALARENTDIVDEKGRKIGIITSGGFGGSVDGPIAMGYVETAFAGIGTPLFLMVRGKPLPAVVAKLPFAPHRYMKG
ncbi:MAG: glycine cleavage system aminomethyltransferase GcvT [Pseudomonadota bacterium]|nr:glycine cleavage system aminomethyltransferase GcvT [Pseudomonadota bacterium]